MARTTAQDATPTAPPARPGPHPGPGLTARGLTLGYDGAPVVTDLDLTLPDGELTAIIGPNGCGKSTVLKAFARTLTPRAGHVLLDGADIRSLRSKAVARRLALLPQGPVAPDSIRVLDLVGRGRYPYHSLLRQWAPDDEAIVAAAMATTGVTDLADRVVAELSGGQRQRVWLAMVLAQDTAAILLDEPTTFLDIAHQIEILELCEDLRRGGRTVVAVLHDLNQAARYATHLVVMKDGAVVQTGHPREVVTAELVREVFGLACEIIADPQTGAPMVVPLKRA